MKKVTRYRLTAIVLTVMLLLPVPSKTKKEIYGKIGNLYNKYFTTDNYERTKEKEIENIIKTKENIFPEKIVVIEPIVEPIVVIEPIVEPIVIVEPIIEEMPVEEEVIEEQINEELIIEDIIVNEEVISNVEEPVVVTPPSIDGVVEELKTKKVAFTFDDGPSAYTKELLDILEANNANATFFVIGTRIDKHSDVIKEMIDDGHQIGSHGVSHSSFTKLTNEQLINELLTTKEKLANYNVAQTIVRPPYGSVNSSVKDVVDYPLIMWSVDTRDWEHRNIEEGTRIIIENIEDGSIILMHDLYKSTIETIREVLPILSDLGYEFVTVSELLEETELENGKTYYKKIK